MTLVDARTLGDGARLDADVCVIGAGAAGITTARALDAQGLRVLLVESGGLAPDADIQSLYDLESVGYPPRENYMSRARQYGGSCTLWAGRCMRLAALDYQPRAWVPDSAWPIDAAEVARHYPAAGAVLGLPELANFEPATHQRLLTADERALLGQPALGPTISLWAPEPQRFQASLRGLRRSASTTVLHHASVTALQLDPAGTRLEAAMARTLEGSELRLRARAFVLACGGLETARLLLVSRDRQPAGIGNGHDLVGRYFMEHPRATYGRVRIAATARLNLMRGWPLADGKVQLGLGFSPELQAKEGLLNHYLTVEETHSSYVEARYRDTVEVGKVLLRRGHAGSRLALGGAKGSRAPRDMIYLLSPKEILPHRVWRYVTLLRRALPQPARERTYVVVYFCEQPPDAASRVRLSDRTDRLGMQQLVLDWRIPPSVDASLLRLQALFGEALAATGVGRLEPGEGPPAYTDASHHMGTTRMSGQPRHGVVDPDCRVHGTANLYVAGSAVFPSAGHANPTLTIVALALRLAAHLPNALRNAA